MIGNLLYRGFFKIILFRFILITILSIYSEQT